MNDHDKRGPTGEFPEGRLNADDEGELRFAVGDQDGNVILDFGKPVTWIGMDPQSACDLATALLQRARAISKEPLTLRIPGSKSHE